MDTLLVLVSFICISAGFEYHEPDVLKPCPILKGRWHLSLLILDATHENLQESDVCVTGEIAVQNSTFMKQSWDMYTPDNVNEPVGNIQFSISVTQPGVWSVQTPLGAKLSATVFGYDENCIMVAHCGLQKGQLVHLWTAGVTRGNSGLTPSLRINLSSLLLRNGYDPSSTKIITWNKSC